MAAPQSREDLKQYALRNLGAPVLEINVDDDVDEDTGLSPVELHKRALERMKSKSGKGFFGEDGQTKMKFD